MGLANGHYRTKAGSQMWISGDHGGRSEVEFDWIEELSACCDCHPDPYESDGWLHWQCEHCGSGSAELFPGRLE